MSRFGESLPLLFFAAVQHPDDDFRRELKKLLGDWVQTLGPLCTMQEVTKALQNCKGTLLEPFILEPEDMEIAGMLVRMAFSKAYEQTRFRIVSRETLGGAGGCIMTSNLKHYYVERYALGKRRITPKKFWNFAPNNVPCNNIVENLGAAMRNAHEQEKCLRASIQLDEDGYQIELVGTDLRLLQWPKMVRLSSMLQKNSCIGDSGETLDTMGVRAEVGRGSISLTPGSPEATMRLTAHMLDGSLLVLDPGPENEGRFKIYLYLTLPSGKKKPLKTQVTVTSEYFCEWLNVGVKYAPDLSRQHRLMIAKWLMAHDSWIDSEFLEAL